LIREFELKAESSALKVLKMKVIATERNASSEFAGKFRNGVCWVLPPPSPIPHAQY